MKTKSKIVLALAAVFGGGLLYKMHEKKGTHAQRALGIGSIVQVKGTAGNIGITTSQGDKYVGQTVALPSQQVVFSPGDISAVILQAPSTPLLAQ